MTQNSADRQEHRIEVSEEGDATNATAIALVVWLVVCLALFFHI